MTIKEVLEVMKNVALRAGEIMTEAADTGFTTSEKTSQKDLVTEIDIRVQDYAVGTLSEKFPKAEFIAEEKDCMAGMKSAELFIIDPIDGTMNFVKGFKKSAISIAYLRNGIKAAGVVYNAFTNELYSAEVGAGAELNGKPIRVTGENLKNSLVCIGTSPYNDAKQELTFRYLKEIYNRCADVRRTGSAALDLCHVAAGNAGLYFEADIGVWDYAAGMIIAEEAGAVVSDFEGRKLLENTNRTSVIAGTPLTLTESGLL